MNEENAHSDIAKKVARATVDASWPQTRVILRVLFIILVVAAVLWVLIKLTGVILLLVLSIFFAYLVAPMVEFVRRPIRLGEREVAIPRVAAITIVYLVILAAFALGIAFVVPHVGNQFPEFAEHARGYWRALEAKTQYASDYLRLHRLPTPVREALNNFSSSVVHEVTVLGQSMLTWVAYLPWLIIIPILSFFLLKDAETFRRSALQMLPRGRWRWRGDEFFQDVSGTLAAYIRAQLMACLFVGLVCALGFTLLGLPSPLVLGFIAGLFEFVPLAGPLTIALLAASAAAIQSGFFSAFVVLLFLGVLRVVQDYFVYPKLIGQGIHLHPLAVIVAILSGAELAGVTGIFLAIPLVAILTVSYKHWLEHRGSEGFADLLEPNAGDAIGTQAHDSLVSADIPTHPTSETTPEQMVRVRPEITGELKTPE